MCDNVEMDTIRLADTKCGATSIDEEGDGASLTNGTTGRATDLVAELRNGCAAGVAVGNGISCDDKVVMVGAAGEEPYEGASGLGFQHVFADHGKNAEILFERCLIYFILTHVYRINSSATGE